MTLKYQSGFGNHFSTESVEGALPHGQNSPQKSPLGLYAEQISGTAFTAARHLNKRTWVYRIQPSVTHGAFTKTRQHGSFAHQGLLEGVGPLQYRWNAPTVNSKVDFLSSLQLLAGNGDANSQNGMNFYVYAFSKNNNDEFFL
jgi:homogentisate 1,2-dioxygenase